MSLLESAIKKASSVITEINEKVPAIEKASSMMMDKVTANVPMYVQIKGMHFFQKVKRPFFVELLIGIVYEI